MLENPGQIGQRVKRKLNNSPNGIGNQKELFKWIRTSVTAYYMYIAYYGLCTLDFNNVGHAGWRSSLQDHWWKCITVWNLALQVRYFLFSFVIDYLEAISKYDPSTYKLRVTLSNIQEFCFVTLDVPIAISVCGGFWLICFVGGELYFPPEISVWIPEWYNHAVHTNPVILVFYQMLTVPHKNPPMRTSVLALIAFSYSYILCISYTRWMTGHWIYIFIEDVGGFSQIAVLFIVTGLLVPLSVHYLTYKLNSRLVNRRLNIKYDVAVDC